MAQQRAKTKERLYYKPEVTEFNGLFFVSGSTFSVIDAPGIVGCNKASADYVLTGSENFKGLVPYDLSIVIYRQTGSLQTCRFLHKDTEFQATSSLNTFTLLSSSGGVYTSLTSGPPTAFTCSISFKAK